MPREMKSFCACAAVLTMCLLPSAHAAGASAQMPPTPAVQTPVPAAGSAAPQDSGAGQMMPVDVQTSPDGTELKKIYDVDAKTSPDQIPQDDFERGGMQYTFQDLLRIEMPDIDRRVHSETVTVSSSSNNSKDVLSLLPESKQVTTADGYAGTAYLDISSISTKVAGTAQVSHDLSAIREYLHRDDCFIRCDQRIDGADVDIRGVVDQAVVILILYLAQSCAQAGLLRTAAVHHHLHIGGEQLHICRDHVDPLIAGMADDISQVGVAIQHQLRDAAALIAMYAKCFAGIALLVVVHDKHALSVPFRQDMCHADSSERLCDAAFQVDDGNCFHFDYPLF